jgi:hypothetical protein
MHRQAELLEPERKNSKHPARVFFACEADDEVVSEPHQERTASQPWLDGLLEPLVEDRVEEDVGEQRRDDASLRRPGIGPRQLAVLHDARL